MANDAAGTTWSEAEPAFTDPRNVGQQEIRGLRKGVRERIRKEHVDLTTGGTFPGGEHKEGSAKAYRQASAPTLRPDGTTALDASDDGRFWVDSDNEHLFVWNGATLSWVPTPGTSVPATITAADLVSAGGWTNVVGVTVLALVSILKNATTGRFDLQYDHAGAGFVTVGHFFGQASNDRGMMMCLVAPSGKIRVQTFSGSAAAVPDIDKAVYQIL